jgi:hypothetical protein
LLSKNTRQLTTLVSKALRVHRRIDMRFDENTSHKWHRFALDTDGYYALTSLSSIHGNHDYLNCLK